MNTIKKNSKFPTVKKMQGQIFTVITGGYDTTSTTLAFICYYVALYPAVQLKLQQENDQHFPTIGQNINSETLQKLPYLDMVFCEVSRLAYVGQLVVQRMCTETSNVVDVTIPKVHQLVPKRFLPECKAQRHPMAYLAFGAGPKNCLGISFALMEAKMTIVNIFQRHTVVKCDKTKETLKCSEEGFGHGPTEEVC